MKIFKLLTLVSIIPLTSFSHKEIEFDILTPVQQGIHRSLFTKVTAAVTTPKKNYLAASILIYFSDETTLEVPISPSPKDVFVSGFNKSLQQLHIDSKSVLDIGFESENLKNFTTKNGKTDHRIGDTEWALIYTLCQLDLKDCLTSIAPHEYSDIKSLELHCHTTRDMCPCCYQHMQTFLDECNKNDSEFDNLFRKIMEMAEKQIPVSFYVSSVCGFLKDSDEFKYSNYTYCSKPLINNSGINCVFLRKNPGVFLPPEKLNPEIKFESLFCVVEPEKAVDEKED